MPLVITPPEKIFFKLLTSARPTSTIELFNDSSEKIAYKIKTTAPQSYKVAPTSGLLEIQQSVVIKGTNHI